MAGVCPVSSEVKNYYRPAPPSPDLYVGVHLLVRLQFSEDPLLLLDVLPSLCDVWGEVSLKTIYFPGSRVQQELRTLFSICQRSLDFPSNTVQLTAYLCLIDGPTYLVMDK